MRIAELTKSYVNRKVMKTILVWEIPKLIQNRPVLFDIIVQRPIVSPIQSSQNQFQFFS